MNNPWEEISLDDYEKFDRLDEVHQQMDENTLSSKMKGAGYKDILRTRIPLPNGKAFVRMDFQSAVSVLTLLEELIQIHDITEHLCFFPTSLLHSIKYFYLNIPMEHYQVIISPYILPSSFLQNHVQCHHTHSQDGETVLVQGIIDAYFIEEDGITVVDYKTDRVSDEMMLTCGYCL